MMTRDGVEVEAKAKDSKNKISRSKTDFSMTGALEAKAGIVKAKDRGHNCFNYGWQVFHDLQVQQSFRFCILLIFFMIIRK